MNVSTESLYTSTGLKLLHNPERLAEIQKGVIRPISIQIAPTDKCNLKCSFCSVKNRPMKELECNDVLSTLEQFAELGAQSVEFTGGGDPTMYPDLEHCIVSAHLLGYKIGLITNGVLLKRRLSAETLDNLTWIRVSLNSLDFVDDLDLPSLSSNTTLGFSYVWCVDTPVSMLDRLKKYADKFNAKYVRIVPNCLDVGEIDKIKYIFTDLGEQSGFFFQTKEYKVPHSCMMGYLKPFVNSDGYIYHCSANPLISRQFNEAFRMGSIADIKGIWNSPKPFDTGNCQEGKCFFKEQNDLIEALRTPVLHKEFI